MYAANIAGQPLTFETAAVWRRNMIMRDRETGALWQHATGEALIGPLAGAKLEWLGGEQMTWAAWRTEHPDTVVALGPAEWSGRAPRALVMRVLEFATAHAAALPGLSANDRRLPMHAPVIGVSLAGEARAYPLATLRQAGVINDSLGGVNLRLTYDPTGDRVQAWRLAAAQSEEETAGAPEPLPVQRTWWKGWFEFHPATGVYQ